MVDAGSKKLVEAIGKRIREPNLTPTQTLTQLMKVNNVSKPGKMSRSDLESYAMDAVKILDLSSYLPQAIPLTKDFMEDVLDPLMTMPVPTGRYRVTMRKLLKLSLTQLQQQAELLKLDLGDLDQEGIAAELLMKMDEESQLIPPLIHILLAKEIAFVYGIRLQIPIRGPAHPSSTISLVLKPWDMIQYLDLTKDALLDECQNQGIPVNRKENKRQLAIRLIVAWNEHPERLRQPFTPDFGAFLLEMARDVGASRR